MTGAVRERQHFGCHPGGFTLIEILLVTIILLVIAGMAIPNFSQSYKGMLLDSTLDTLRSTMLYAQSRAITHNRRTTLVFHPDNGQYWLEEDVAGEEGGRRRIDGNLGRVKKISGELQASVPEKLTFYPDGQADSEVLEFCHGSRCKGLSTADQRGRIISFSGSGETSEADSGR